MKEYNWDNIEDFYKGMSKHLKMVVWGSYYRENKLLEEKRKIEKLLRSSPLENYIIYPIEFNEKNEITLAIVERYSYKNQELFGYTYYLSNKGVSNCYYADYEQAIIAAISNKHTNSADGIDYIFRALKIE